jgi:hypothetical protein
MGRTTLVLLVTLAAGPTAPAQTVSDAERKEGFVSLFNGKDFSGWRFSDNSALPDKLPANWKVEDGVIKLSGGGSPHCASQWDYEDFDVRFEWRAMRKNYNSGFYIRSGRKVGANQINLAKGGEGGFLGGKLKGAKTVPTLQKPPFEWNEWRVLAVGDKVTFWCNGQLAWEGTEFKSKRGYLGLQAEGAPIEFRNLRLKEIGYEPLNDLALWEVPADGSWQADAAAQGFHGKAGRLRTRKTYKDVVLRLEWKAEPGTRIAIWPRDGSQQTVVSLGDDAGSGSLPSAPAKGKKADNPSGQWNYLEVRLEGGRVTVWLNGTVVNDVTLRGLLPAAGAVALQLDGQPASFRNVRVKEL